MMDRCKWADNTCFAEAADVILEVAESWADQQISQWTRLTGIERAHALAQLGKDAASKLEVIRIRRAAPPHPVLPSCSCERLPNGNCLVSGVCTASGAVYDVEVDCATESVRAVKRRPSDQAAPIPSVPPSA